MTDTTVSPAEAADQPDHFAEIAAELRKAASQVETLVGSGLPRPCQFVLNIQPGGRDDDELTARAVDAMAGALLGIRGMVHEMSSGTYHYATGQVERGPIAVTVYQGVSAEWALKREHTAKLAEREAELEKLRAEVAELRAGRSGMDFSDLADRLNTDAAPVPTTTAGYANGDRSGALVEVHPADTEATA